MNKVLMVVCEHRKNEVQTNFVNTFRQPLQVALHLACTLTHVQEMVRRQGFGKGDTVMVERAVPFNNSDRTCTLTDMCAFHEVLRNRGCQVYSYERKNEVRVLQEIVSDLVNRQASRRILI